MNFELTKELDLLVNRLMVDGEIDAQPEFKYCLA
jgi:hypothetical protein